MGDTRGVSGVVGAVMLFGILVISLSIYQASVVPAQNADVEYQHSQQAQDEMQQVGNALVQSAQTNASIPASMKLGTTYPGRTFTVNPPPATGTLETDYLGTITLKNINDVSAVPAKCFTNGTHSITVPTERLRYTPHNYEYRTAPTVSYEYGLVYNEVGGGTAALTDQTLLTSNRINLVALGGNYSKTEVGRVTLRPETGKRTQTAVRNQSDENLTLSFVTTLNESQWTRMTDLDEYGTVESTSLEDGYHSVTVTLPRKTYTLSMSTVSLGDGLCAAPSAESDGPTNQKPTADAGGPYTVASGESTQLDGSASTDPEGSSLDYHWTITDGGEYATLTNADTETPTLDASDVTQDRTVTVELTVTDALGKTDTDTAGVDIDRPSTSLSTSNVETFGDGHSGVSFDLTNDGGSSVTITGLGVASTNASADWIHESNGGNGRKAHEFYADGPSYDNSYWDDQYGGTYDVGDSPTSLSGSVTLDPGETTTLSYYEFRDSNGDTVDMRGKSLTAQVEFETLGVRSYHLTTAGDSGGDVQHDIKYDGGLTATDSNSALQFDISNLGSDDAKLTDVRVKSSTPSVTTIHRWNDDEVKLTGGNGDRGVDDHAWGISGSEKTFSLGWNAWSLKNSGTGSTKESGTVNIGEFGDDSWNEIDVDSWEKTDAAGDWDVRVRLDFENRGTVTYYFKRAANGGGDVQNDIVYEGGLTANGGTLQFDISSETDYTARLLNVYVTSDVQQGTKLYHENGDGSGDGEVVRFVGGSQDGHSQTRPMSDAVDVSSRTEIDFSKQGQLSASSPSGTIYVGEFGHGSGNNFHAHSFGTLTKVSESDDWTVRIVLDFQQHNGDFASDEDAVYYFKET